MPDSLKTYIDYKDSLLNDKLVHLKDSLALKPINTDEFMGIGEEWWTHIILPIFIPLIAFLLLRLRDKWKILRDLKAKQDFIFTWIGLIAEPIKKQAAAYSSFATGLRELEVSKNGLGKYNLAIDKLQYYNSEELVKLFVKSRRQVGYARNLDELLFSFENSVDFIKRKQASVTSLLEELKLIYGETSNKWNENFYKLREILHIMHLDYKNGIASESVATILKLHAEYTSQKEEGMKAAMEKFINIIGPIANDDINEFPENILMRQLVECVVQLKNVYTSRKKHFEDIANSLDEASEKLMSSFEKIKQVEIELRSYPFKRVLAL